MQIYVKDCKSFATILPFVKTLIKNMEQQSVIFQAQNTEPF